jgi:diadenosine tetraphosphate (Ap4A) HIT family hydrolase
MPHRLPDFVNWPTFPFVGDLRVRPLEEPSVEPVWHGHNGGACPTCDAPDESYVWVNERWRVRATTTPPGLPMVLILESRSHLDLGDLSNLLAAELGVMTVRLERAVRSLDGVATVQVDRWGDGDSHLHLWFFGRPRGQLQLRGSFLSLWNDILPPIDEAGWRENLALVAAWLAEFGGRALAEPPRINWQAPASLAAARPSGPRQETSPAPTAGPSASTGSFASTGGASRAYPTAPTPAVPVSWSVSDADAPAGSPIPSVAQTPAAPAGPLAPSPGYVETKEDVRAVPADVSAPDSADRRVPDPRRPVESVPGPSSAR